MECCIHSLIRDIYRLAYKVPLADFKQRCFELISEALKIDCGTWITRSDAAVQFYENDSYTFALPHGFIEDYEQQSSVSAQIQQVYAEVLSNPGKALDILDVIPEQEWFQSDLYKLYCEKFSLYHSLMTVTVNPKNNNVNLITFARTCPNHRFTERDKDATELLFPNLIEALRINILNSFHDCEGHSAYRAVLDRYGSVIEAEENFLSVLAAKGYIKGGKLTLDLKAHESKIDIEGLVLKYKNYNGIVYAQIITPPLDRIMGPRKLQICEHLVKGKSNKEIARVLELSPNTVNNHLKEIYKLLNVNTRHQAMAYLFRQPF